jgi:hypothetical protein
MSSYLLNSYDLYPPGASRDPTFGVSGWVSSGGFGNLIGGDSGFALELAGGADGSSEFIRYYPPMQFRRGTPSQPASPPGRSDLPLDGEAVSEDS